MNFATFAGRIGKDAIIKDINGDKVASFSLAVKERQNTLWVDCSVWGKRAEALAQYLTKGTAVTVCGPLSVRTYEGKSGFQAQLQVRVSELSLMGGGQSAAPAPTAPTAETHEDDIPF